MIRKKKKSGKREGAAGRKRGGDARGSGENRELQKKLGESAIVTKKGADTAPLYGILIRIARFCSFGGVFYLPVHEDAGR